MVMADVTQAAVVGNQLAVAGMVGPKLNEIQR